jgi:hypothetical protein
MNHRNDPAPAVSAPSAEPKSRVFSLRWPDGREERASGKTAAAAALSLGYGFDDFKDLTWEEQP